MLEQIRYGVGSWVRVRNVHGGYRLPEGLQQWARVRVEAMDAGMRRVRWRGRSFDVPMACIDSGWRRT